MHRITRKSKSLVSRALLLGALVASSLQAQPDLALEGSDSWTFLGGGNWLTGYVTIKNRGTDASSAGVLRVWWTLRPLDLGLWLESYPKFPTDRWLGDFPVGALDPDASARVRVRSYFPRSWPYTTDVHLHFIVSPVEGGNRGDNNWGFYPRSFIFFPWEDLAVVGVNARSPNGSGATRSFDRGDPIKVDFRIANNGGIYFPASLRAYLSTERKPPASASIGSTGPIGSPPQKTVSGSFEASIPANAPLGASFLGVQVIPPHEDQDTTNDWHFITGIVTQRFDGASAGDRFGHSVSGAGDVNADGYADVIVGAPNDDNNGLDSGSACILSGKDSTVLYTFSGERGFHHFGWSVSGAGDVNGDGYADVIVGAPNDSASHILAGSARILSGKDGLPLMLVNGYDEGMQLGYAVGKAGDVNDDGYADVIIGAPFESRNGPNSGSAVVIQQSGPARGVILSFRGTSAGDRFGWSVAGAGDVNADGYSDVIVGAPGDDDNGTESGSASVMSGKDGAVLYTFYGDSAGDNFGFSVSGAGDVNSDGFADVIVGAPYDNNKGSARVLSGKDGAVLYTFDGDSTRDRFGWSVDTAGDVNGDGFADVIVGAPSTFNNRSGRARVLSGKDGVVLHTFDGDNATDDFAYSVSGAGDINGDGFADVVVGMPSADPNGADSGSARIFALGGLAPATAYTRDGQVGSLLGWSVSDAGDVNGDGYGDFIAGSPGRDNAVVDAGEFYVWSGKDGTNLMAGGGSIADNLLGWSVSGAGDVDADRRADVIVGAPGPDSAPGICYVYSYTTAGGRTVLALDGEGAGDRFGWSVSGVGDVNGDGLADVIVGAPQRLVGSRGYVHLRSGRDGTVLWRKAGDATDSFGYSVSGVGDINGDGVPDVIVGAPDEVNFTEPGSARVLSGRDGSLLRMWNGDAAGSLFGFSVSGAGDVNGDGHADVIVGAPAYANATGMVRVFSGRDYSVLHTWYGDAAGDQFGYAVRDAGDVDGDGFGDVIIGIVGRNRVYVYSGQHGVVLRQLEGESNSGFGAVSGAGDVDGDGLADVIVGARFRDAVFVFTQRPQPFPGSFQTYGPPCDGQSGELPQIGVRGRPVIGQPLTMTVRALRNTSAAMLIGWFRTDVRLDGSCTLLASPVVNWSVPISPDGRGELTFRVPNLMELVGEPFGFQWVTTFSSFYRFSNGGEVRIGHPWVGR